MYGRHAVREVLRARRRRLYRLLVAEGVDHADAIEEIEELAKSLGVPVEMVSRGRVDEVSPSVNHQGVALMASPYPYVELHDLFPATPPVLYLALDTIQDPQNLGTLLRTADAVGVRGVVIPQHRAAAVTPAVVNASAGAVEYLRVARVNNLARSLATFKQEGVWTLALEGVADAPALWDVDLGYAVLLVVGSEGYGIRRLVLEECDLVARLPMKGHVASLNAAVAGSVALYALARSMDADLAP